MKGSWCPRTKTRTRKRRKASPTGTRETAAGRIRYAVRGEGAETVLLIHGFGGDLDNWLFNLDALAAESTVVALDLTGSRPGPDPDPRPFRTGLATAVFDFMDAAEVETAHLVGHSLGGAVALAIAAAAAPERVRSVTLVCPAGLGPDVNRGYIDGFVSSASRRQLKPVLENLFADPGLVNRSLVDGVLRYKRLDGVTESLEALADGVFPGGAQALVEPGAVAGLGVPVLVVWGAEDRIVPAAHAEAAAGAGAAVEIVAGAGHMVQMEAAPRVNSLITAHVARAAA